MAGGFLFEDVEGGVGDPVFGEGFDEALFLDGAAAAGVDEDGVGFHHPEVGFGEHSGGFGGAGGVHGDEVGGAEDFLEGGGEDAVGGHYGFVDEGVVGDHAQAEGGGAAGDGAGDVAEGDEAEGLAHEAVDFVEGGAAFFPAAIADHAVLFEEAALGGEEEGHGVVGDFLDEGIGAVGDWDAVGGGGGDVDEVDADAAEGDDLAVFELVDDGFGQAAAGVDGVGVAGGGDEAGFVGGDFGDGAAGRA